MTMSRKESKQRRSWRRAKSKSRRKGRSTSRRRGKAGTRKAYKRSKRRSDRRPGKRSRIFGNKPQTFVTGGQTGADSIPFTVYKRLGISLRGFMPSDFSRDDGCGRKIAEKYGLQAGEGGFKWRDKKNASLADACIGFLTTKPMTGKGTMQTANVFVNGEYEFVVLPKPENAYHLVIEPHGKAGRPVIVFWDISTERLSGFAAVLREFFNKYKPQSVMFSGSTETTWPGVERLGAQLLLLTFDIDWFWLATMATRTTTMSDSASAAELSVQTTLLADAWQKFLHTIFNDKDALRSLDKPTAALVRCAS